MVAGLRLPEHSHCIFCGDPLPFGEEYCDDQCRVAEAERARKERNKEYKFWGSAIVIMAVVFAIGIIL